jgi:hypothetical protein
MRGKLKRPSPGLVVAVIALFAAIGGGYAVGANKIQTKEIAAKAVTNKKIAKKTIKAGRVAPDTLTGEEIQEDSLDTVPSAEVADVAGTGRSIFKDTAIQVPAGSGFTTALTLNVPAGSYMFIAKTVLAKAGTPDPVQCRVRAEGSTDRSLAYVNATSNETLVNTAVHTFNAPGSAVFECDNPSPDLLLLTNSRLTAIPFAELENVEAP